MPAIFYSIFPLFVCEHDSQQLDMIFDVNIDNFDV